MSFPVQGKAFIFTNQNLILGIEFLNKKKTMRQHNVAKDKGIGLFVRILLFLSVKAWTL